MRSSRRRVAKVVKGHPYVGGSSGENGISVIGTVILMAPITCVFFSLLDLPSKMKLSPPLGWMASVAMLLAYLWIATRSWYASIRLMKPWVLRGLRKKHADLAEQDGLFGVAFADEAWAIPEETSWDLGLLSVEDGYIRFQGRTADFALTKDKIKAIEIFTCCYFTMRRYFVCLTWAAPDGSLQKLSLEPREAIGYSGELKLARDLQSRIEALGEAPELAAPLPPLSTDMPLEETPQSAADNKSKVISMVISIALIACVVLVADWYCVHTNRGVPSWIAGLSGVFTINLYRDMVPYVNERRSRR